MAINFDKVPTTNPYSAIAVGKYRGRVEKAEFKRAEVGSGKKDRIDLTYAIYSADGKRLGNVFDRLFDSDAPAVMFKIGRFVTALELHLTGNIELKDLAKIVKGKEFIVELTHEPDNRAPDDRSRDRAVPRIFGSEIFWPVSEAAELIGEGAATDASEETVVVPFNVDEAAEEAATEY